MESIFDIPADLDTPVSAHLRLAALRPRDHSLAVSQVDRPADDELVRAG